MTRKGILEYMRVFELFFLKKHLSSVSIKKNTSSIFLNLQNYFSKYYQTLLFFPLKKILSVLGLKTLLKGSLKWSNFIYKK